MNALIVSGNLGADAEVRVTSGGKKVASFRIAVKDGKDTLWLSATMWEPREALVPHLTKGTSVILNGRLSIREYEDKQGNKRQTTEIVVNSLDFTGGKREGGESEAPPAKANKSNKSTRDDNDIPF